jgi:hypothetical protein
MIPLFRLLTGLLLLCFWFVICKLLFRMFVHN